MEHKNEIEEYIIDEERNQDLELRNATGIYIRAHDRNEKWQSVDIAVLTKESLLKWLKSRGGNNPLAENVVGVLLGYGHLNKK